MIEEHASIRRPSIGVEPELDQFVLACDALQVLPLPESPLEEVLRQYALRETRQRVHQPVFRSMVMRAYETQCAVCALRHTQLLDAAHIIPDSADDGIKGLHGDGLRKLPARRGDRPDRDLLDRRFRRFLSA